MEEKEKKEIKIISQQEIAELPITIQEWVTQQKMLSGLHKIRAEDTEYTLISLGMRPNPGYQLRVTHIIQQGTEAQIKVTEQEPTPGMFYPQVVVYPFVLAESVVPVDVEGFSVQDDSDQKETQS